MKMIIELSKDVYDDIKYRFEKQDYECGYIVASAIVFGTPLEEELENTMENRKLIEELQSIKDELLEKTRNDEKTQMTTQEMLIDTIYSILNERIKMLENN